jgi:hypothetical protein
LKSDERKHRSTSAITRPNITYKNDASTRPLPSSTEPPILRARSDQNARYHGPIGFRHPTGFMRHPRRPASVSGVPAQASSDARLLEESGSHFGGLAETLACQSVALPDRTHARFARRKRAVC